MRTYELGDVIAERRTTLEAADGSTRDVEVRIGRPVRDGTGENEAWVCAFQITGLGRDRVIGAWGIDAFQALLGAVHLIPVELAAAIRRKGGHYLLFGKPDDSFLHGCAMAIEYAGDVLPSKTEKPSADDGER